MSQFQAPPTYAELLLIDQKSGKAAFNPIWLNWFISLTQNIGAAGPVNSVTASSPLASSGGSNPIISLSSFVGTGPVARAIAPGFSAPFLGVATATSIEPAAGGYLASDASPGINASITTGSLVGKTITVKDGIITSFV